MPDVDVTVVVDPEKSPAVVAALKDQEATIEGLGQENTRLEREVSSLDSRLGLALAKSERLAKALSDLRHAVTEATQSVLALRDVPLSDLDDVVGVVANELDTAVLS